MRLRVIVFALVATAVAVGLILPSAGAKPKPVKPGQFVTYTCATGETAGSGTVAWFDKDGQVISISTATASGATLIRPDRLQYGSSPMSFVASSAFLQQRPRRLLPRQLQAQRQPPRSLPRPRLFLTRPFISQDRSRIQQMVSLGSSMGATRRWASRFAKLEPRLTLMRALLRCPPT
jgi:hypothetical protein